MAGANKKTFLSAAVLALVAGGASAPVIMDQFIREKESSDRYELKAYLDGAKVWTVCDGKTKGVTKDTVMTKAQCDEWRKTEIAKRLTFVHSIIKVNMSEPAWAGVGSWCFNVGNTGCKGSTTVRLINQSRQVEGCKAMLMWRFITRDKKKIDCSTEQPWCSGLWERRQGESELCQL